MASDEPPCGLCGDAGHTHDEHWILLEARSLGLRVITDADKAVLDAMSATPEWWLRAGASMPEVPAHWVCKAELARREANRVK